jgi:hypothetical protein
MKNVLCAFSSNEGLDLVCKFRPKITQLVCVELQEKNNLRCMKKINRSPTPVQIIRRCLVA